MIRSQYMTAPDYWSDRVRTLRDNLEAEDYGRLYFLLALCLIDAYDAHDYDRHEAVSKAIAGLKAHDYEAIEKGIDELEGIEE